MIRVADPNTSSQICSLRCGGQALNLTCANRTIMVDLWWNLAVESQATARVYRMGQKKETYSVRIIVEDSVDQRLYAVQEIKAQALQNVFLEFEGDRPLDTATLYKVLGWKPSRDEYSDDEDSDDGDFDDDDGIDYDDDSDVDPKSSYNPSSRTRRYVAGRG